MHAAPRRYRVVGRNEQPPFLIRFSEEPPLRLQGYQRFDIIPHDPGKLQMGHGRRNIGQEAGCLSVRGHQNGLMIRRMAGREHNGYARDNRTWPLQQSHKTGTLDRIEVVPDIAGLCPLIDVMGVLPLPPLDVVPRSRERSQDLASFRSPRITPRMIEVQMGVDDDAYVVGLEAEVIDRRLQAVGAGKTGGRSRLNPIDVDELLRFLGPDSRFYQHELVAGFDEEAAEAQRDPV